MTGTQAKQLYDCLVRADSEAEVVQILKEAKLWDDPAAWRFYGDKPRNWATVGGQQSKPDHALVEKLTNAIDTKLIAAARIKKQMDGASAPQSVFEARDVLFGEQLKDMEALSKSITVAATGRRTASLDHHRRRRRRASRPRRCRAPSCRCTKATRTRSFSSQGKFNMGGSGVLEFCGLDHNVELVLSRKNPKLLPANASAEDQQVELHDYSPGRSGR